MRPILLKGHERSITVVKYNRDGDLLFTASKDHVPSVWRAEDGSRLGTFNGHKGTIWDLDSDSTTTYLLSASADTTVKLWSICDGQIIRDYPHRGPVRGVAWAAGGQMFATISDPFVEHPGYISVFAVPKSESPEQWSEKPILEIELPKNNKGQRVNATNVVWLNLNEAIFVTFDNGCIRLYDPENGEELEEIQPHEKKINRVSFNRNKTMFITSSADFTAKLYDVVELEHLKTYQTDRPVNDAVISPTKDHILLGGGQEAMSVTTTAGKVGKFETRFFHLVYEEEFGIVKGHFGPINALDINPNGLSYASE
uniref:Eukaryotic translation initiation factor 3 subunit I n=1 Tax=Leptocylindrus danicus TaxID=163516 RepID=A0A7S2JXV0_9STRA|mmetsp:Transcript_140/g.188  ORF Transcript_140/g.188 Transcript_140/m.188 type:complete len:312 (+) Transcript_140:45-980(+)